MSARLRILTKLKIALPMVYLFVTFLVFSFAIFGIPFRITQVIGALITFVSFILWIIARIQLGDAPAEGRLITKGLYGEVRHPIYYFSTTAFIGILIFLLIIELWFLLIPLLAFYIVRIRYEEKQLIQQMGRRYQRYKQRTLL